jgi:hypothetical protein
VKPLCRALVIASMVAGLVGSGAVALCGCGTAASATTSAGSPASNVEDRRATAAFLAAQRVVAVGLASTQMAGKDAVERYAASAIASCPGAAASVLRGGEHLVEISSDVDASTAVVLARAHSKQLTRFAAAITRVTWSDATLTALVRRLAAIERTLAARVPLDVCGALKSWARSGYRTLPATVVRFQVEKSRLVKYSATSCDRILHTGVSVCALRSPPPTVAAVNKLLMPYENTSQLEMVREVEAMEAKRTAFERSALTEAASSLTRTFGLDERALRRFEASLR